VERFDIFVVGGGACGSEVAFGLAGERGLRVGLAERDRLGGECAHYGCDPTKTMLQSAKVAAMARRAGRYGIRTGPVEVDFAAVMARVRQLVESNTGEGEKPFRDAGVTVVPDEVRVVGPHRLEDAAGRPIEAGRIVLAVGTEPTAPPIPGLEDGPWWSNREAIWAPEQVPGSLGVIGSGPIGVEFAQLYARFGSRVTVLETADRLLPGVDADAGAALAPALEEDGVAVLTGAEVAAAEHGPGGWRVRVDGRPDLEVDELLVATGRTPRLAGHDLAAAGVELDGDRPVLDERLRTTGDGIWVAGDATGELLFTHVADYEAGLVVADVLGRPARRDYRVVPNVTYCEPEVAGVGLTEEAARSAGHRVATALVRLADNDRARIAGQPHGVVKLVADAGSAELLGGHIVAEGAGELLGEVVAVMAGHVPVAVVARAVHPYPTLSQSVAAAFAQLAGKLARA
jgi:pyruvate/2-oxoglutarate dehydrogenase complex dihydrolipoamide dehydrogenase (E3) component